MGLAYDLLELLEFLDVTVFFKLLVFAGLFKFYKINLLDLLLIHVSYFGACEF